MRDVIRKYGIGYKRPTYNDIWDKLLKRTVLQTDQVFEDFKVEWKRTCCSIMFDGWTYRKKRSICNLMVNSSKGTIFLYSPDTSNISKTSNRVCKMLDDAVEFVGKENVIQVVTHNARNFKAGGELQMLKRRNLYMTSFTAYCIDLIFEDFEKELIFHQVTVKNIDYHGDEIHKWEKSDYRPAMTRFATAYSTLGYLNDLQSLLINIFSSEDWISGRFATTKEGKKIAKGALDNQF
ncbi:hypothetical protein QQ045_032913 [Rhodiola kirilowii]